MSDSDPKTREQLREMAQEDPQGFRVYVNANWARVSRILSGQPEPPADLTGASNAELAQATRDQRWPEVEAEMSRRAKARVAKSAELAASADEKLRARSPAVIPDGGAGDRGGQVVTLAQVQERAKEDPSWVNAHWDQVRHVLEAS